MPYNVYNIQVFLGFAKFYKRFIKSYSKVIVLLTDLFKKSLPNAFDLDINNLVVFTKLKFLFIKAFILTTLFRPNITFLIGDKYFYFCNRSYFVIVISKPVISYCIFVSKAIKYGTPL
jgi:hypothetical protein